jgi:hypothetical protein
VGTAAAQWAGTAAGRAVGCTAEADSTVVAAMAAAEGLLGPDSGAATSAVAAVEAREGLTDSMEEEARGCDEVQEHEGSC